MTNDPIQQEIDQILKGEQAKIMAEDAYGCAGMLLVATIEKQTATMAVLLKRSHDRGPEYLTAMLVSLIMMSRALAQGYAANPDVNFADSLRHHPDPDEAEDLTIQYMRRFMGSDGQEESLVIATDLQATLRGLSTDTGARMAMCLVRSSAQLVTVTLEQANILSMEHIRGDHDH